MKEKKNIQETTCISIPRDENGDYMFTRVSAEQTYIYLHSQEDLTPEDIDMIVNLNIQDARKRIENLKVVKPKPVLNLNEYRVNKAKWEAEKQQAKTDLDYWSKVKAIDEIKKTRCYSNFFLNRRIIWLLGGVLMFCVVWILFMLPQLRADKKKDLLRKEVSCVESVEDKVIKYQITTEDGIVHNVSKRNIEKYGWREYAEDYPKATVRMRDENNDDYDIPIVLIDKALTKKLRPFTILYYVKANKVFRSSNGDATVNGKEWQVNDTLFTVMVAMASIFVGIYFTILKTKKIKNDMADMGKANSSAVKTILVKNKCNGKISRKKVFYYLVLILLWIIGTLLLGILLLLFGIIPNVVSWAYSIGTACTRPAVWFISLGFVFLIRSSIYNFIFKKKAFNRNN